MFIARMEEKSPELKKLIFPARKQRPAEARFVVWKNSFFSEDLKRTAGKSFYKLSITDVNRSVICSTVPIPSTA